MREALAAAVAIAVLASCAATSSGTRPQRKANAQLSADLIGADDLGTGWAPPNKPSSLANVLPCLQPLLEQPVAATASASVALIKSGSIPAVEEHLAAFKSEGSAEAQLKTDQRLASHCHGYFNTSSGLNDTWAEVSLSGNQFGLNATAFDYTASVATPQIALTVQQKRNVVVVVGVLDLQVNNGQLSQVASTAMRRIT